MATAHRGGQSMLGETMPREVTISACQYHVREIRGFEDMAARVRTLLDQASGSDIVFIG